MRSEGEGKKGRKEERKKGRKEKRKKGKKEKRKKGRKEEKENRKDQPLLFFQHGQSWSTPLTHYDLEIESNDFLPTSKWESQRRSRLVHRLLACNSCTSLFWHLIGGIYTKGKERTLGYGDGWEI